MSIEPHHAHTVHIRTVLKEMAKAGRVTKAKGALGVVHWRLAESKEGTE